MRWLGLHCFPVLRRRLGPYGVYLPHGPVDTHNQLNEAQQAQPSRNKPGHEEHLTFTGPKRSSKECRPCQDWTKDAENDAGQEKAGGTAVVQGCPPFVRCERAKSIYYAAAAITAARFAPSGTAQ